jgi:hypothetical protein
MERRNSAGLPVLDTPRSVVRPNLRTGPGMRPSQKAPLQLCHRPGCQRTGMIVCDGLLWCQHCYSSSLAKAERSLVLVMCSGVVIVLGVLISLFW